MGYASNKYRQRHSDSICYRQSGAGSGCTDSPPGPSSPGDTDYRQSCPNSGYADYRQSGSSSGHSDYRQSGSSSSYTDYRQSGPSYFSHAIFGERHDRNI